LQINTKNNNCFHQPIQYFDPSLAVFPTCSVDIHRIIDLLPVTHAAERIDHYRSAMQAGDCFPPISVLRCGRYFIIADGHKRFQACRTLPVNHIIVEVWPLRRWLLDQWQQFMRKTRQQWHILRRCPYDAQARTEALQLAGNTLRHWRRVLLSLGRLLRSQVASLSR
jgi:hypothetical protein